MAKMKTTNKKLIIVESPAKARTIGRILGKNYSVLSSVGHIRDLPRTRFGIDIKGGFQPEYVNISGKQKVIEAIKKAAQSSDEVFLAADPDREGEAICWHLVHFMKNSKAAIHRIMYHEITPAAIKASLSHPGTLDMNKVNAQQARRVLDRIVGYRWSPLLWKKVKGGLSAGRVQSVAIKIICDREREIQAFTPKEYWIISARLEGQTPPAFNAVYHGSNGKRIKLADGDATASIVEDTKGNPFTVASLNRRTVNRRPPPPFITSTLQQDAARRFRFTAKKTMRVAQHLYEGKNLSIAGVHGLITYMRTDSPRISKDAQDAARTYIKQTYGDELLPASPPRFKARKGAQEAHEAIRPTSVDLTPEQAAKYLQGDELKLYRIIWERFIASQMTAAKLNVTTATINAGPEGTHQFRATGTVVEFDGFWRLTGSQATQKTKTGQEAMESQSQILPSLKEGETLTCSKLESDQKFTKPPARFSEATLVRELETKGIGRPSTYASILSTIRSHDYVVVEERKFKPTELGFTVTDMLTKTFPEIMSTEFSARMETRLTNIENGEETWGDLVKVFYESFIERFEQAQSTLRRVKPVLEEVEGAKCPECGGPMVIRKGKKGKFLSCKAFPSCKGASPLVSRSASPGKSPIKTVLTGASCPECQAPLALKVGRYGLFSTCSRFPACRGKSPSAKGLPCAKTSCDGHLVQRRGKNRKTFFGCSNYPECTFLLSGVLVMDTCPSCGFSYLGATCQKDTITLTCPRCSHKVDLQEESADHGESDTKIPDIS
jgi:DNA topoisomerase I